MNITNTQWIVFGIGTLLLLAVSWRFLVKGGVHGFYRFFAWECMLVVFILGLGHPEYVQPLSIKTACSAFLFSSLLLALVSWTTLVGKGKLNASRDDLPLYSFEKTTTLVNGGIYRYIRHPIYMSLFLLCWGLFFRVPSLLGGLFAVVASGFLLVTALSEEQENLNYFGEAYRAYMRNTKRFIPFLL